ncbi:DUF4123 domain-containing protein [Pseudomonas sp. P8_241]|jgi:hypothetical protein|uniref:DUF4123 domain-containing protein n=1 Tax=Pseudomonas sp. P8_241 TaxID=3043445 RepID=UPI002A35A096|nr:DUF4123 domain-containing protein [Pseudomonas sp. P8_241]WPN48949.1 DUF4123 domain-containing protein [Pseudomonas sp. P8_241]
MNQAYLLLDAAQIANLPIRLFELGCNTVFHPLYQQTAYHALDAVGPVLVPVLPNSPLARTFIQEWSETAGIWLESEADEAVLLVHLRSLIHARVEGDVTVFFRYYDPRITHLWLADLLPTERDGLMGPIRLIMLPESVDRSGFIRQENPEQAAAQYADKPWLYLSAQQLDHLNQAKRQCLARRLIEHSQQHFPQSLQGLDHAAQQQWAASCQRSAERQGYGAADEVMCWAKFHAVLGEDFPCAPGHGVYRQILAEAGVLPEQRLENLNAELTRQLLTDKEFSV